MSCRILYLGHRSSTGLPVSSIESASREYLPLTLPLARAKEDSAATLRVTSAIPAQSGGQRVRRGPHNTVLTLFSAARLLFHVFRYCRGTDCPRSLGVWEWPTRTGIATSVARSSDRASWIAPCAGKPFRHRQLHRSPGDRWILRRRTREMMGELVFDDMADRMERLAKCP